MELKGSRTEANLRAAYAGESQARNLYTFFGSIAKKRGLEQIAAIFLETAENEREHAKLFLKALDGLAGDPVAHLLRAAEGEKEEWESLYPEFARVAREEGFGDIAALFEGVAAVEAHHESRYRELAHHLSGGTLFKKPTPTRWVCRNCGHVHEGTEAPKTCPVCKHPQGFFELARAAF